MEVKEPSAKYLARPGYKQTEMGFIPLDWDVKQIADFKPFVTSGSRGWAAFYSERGSPFIRITNLSRTCIYPDLHDLRFVDVAANDSEVTRTQLCDEDVLISITADIGIVGHVTQSIPKPAYINQHIALVRFDQEQINSRFVSYFLASANSQKLIRALTDSGAKAGMNLTTVQKICIALPPTKTEQQAIADALSDADALVDLLQRLLTKKRQLKQGAMQDVVTGKRRLPGFSGAWETKRLGATAVLKARIGWQGLTTAEYLDSGDYYLVTGTEFKEGYIDWSNCHYVDEPRYKQDKNIQLKAHDVLVTKDGTIGKVAFIADLPKPATLNSGVFVIRPIKDSFHPEFFYYQLCSTVFAEFLAQLSAGSTINHLYQKDFEGFIYATPPTIDEQIAIAAILSDMDTDIAALEAKLCKARQTKQGMMQELLTGRIRLLPSTAVPIRSEQARSVALGHTHSRHVDEAVVIAALADQFGSKQYPLGRLRRTKLAYLLKRKCGRGVDDYIKKAAGPYNPRARYGGAEKIAVARGYVRQHRNGEHEGFVSGPNVREAKAYFETWYGINALTWLDQFRFKKNEELELLATVDMAIEELRRAGKPVMPKVVKNVIRRSAEWRAKLNRTIFSDRNIGSAVDLCQRLFSTKDNELPRSI